ncbi:hypothetical protein QCN27_10275 [Cereibacter sp. SYSU M97828]|nr:hypothetical protein [Cereibacter flavus]
MERVALQNTDKVKRDKISQTISRIEAELKCYREEILDQKNWIIKDGINQYKHRISVAEVRLRAGIASRSTLASAHYKDVKNRLDTEIEALKVMCGKRKPPPATFDDAATSASETDRRKYVLEQIIAAQDFEIKNLKQQLSAAKNVSHIYEASLERVKGIEPSS